MKYAMVRAKELEERQWNRWAEIQSGNPSLRNPYFSPQFTQAVGGVRDDVWIVVLEEQVGGIAGFFPFQRRPMGIGQPVGGALSDFQGVIASPEIDFDPRELIAATGLRVWRFDHLLGSQTMFAPYRNLVQQSPYMDLSDGYEAYTAGRRQAGSEQIKQLDRKIRRIEREVGPLRFVAHEKERQAFASLLKWKSAQYLASGTTDIFRYPWTVQLLERLMEIQEPDFAGILSCLYVGDKLIAAHMGMRSGRIWHYWFPSYDEAFSKYSPGLILLLMMAEAAQSLGLQAIDLGKGDMRYKQQMASGNTELMEGCVEIGAVAPAVRRMRVGAERLAARANLPKAAKIPDKFFRRIERWQRFR